ncbi:MAG: PAS domain S-box protein, partial [Polaribacter sp.]|nr:PAS domain S-box protein [Polaribacter sp.]
ALSSFEKCISTQEPYAIEAVIINASNKEVWVQTTAKAEFVDGVCTRVYGSFQDIDDRKQSEIRLQSFSENLPGVVYQYIIHPDGTDSMQFISGMVEKLWGYTTNEVMQNIDLLWDQIKQGGDIEEVKSSIAKSIETKSKWACRFKIINHTGEIRTHFGSGTPIFLADGTILFHVMVLDITQEAKNEELLEEVTNMARIGSWELDLINQDGDSIYWSPILREIVEVDESYNPTLTGGIEFHVGESKERIQKAIDLLINEGTEFDEEVLLRTAKGNERWNRCIGKREMANGKLIRIYGSYQDIHERKTSELELLTAIKKAEESDARFKSYTEQSPIGIYTTDINGDCIYANETWLEMAGMQLEEALGKGWMNALHPEDLEYVTDNWYKLIESHGEWNYEYRFVNSNKDITWVNGNAKKLFNNKNELIGFLGANVNITERKKAEQEKNSLLTTLEKSLNEIYVFDAETLKCSYANQGALNNIGYSEQEIKELTPLDLKPEFTATTFNQLVNPLITKEKEKIIFFTNHKRKNGSLYPVEIHLQLVTEDDNKRFLAVILDITERKEADEKLLNAYQEKNDILESIGDAFYALDGELNFTYMNASCANLLAVKKEKIIGKNLFIEFPDLKNTKFEEELRKVQHTVKASKFEFYYAPFDAWFDESIYPTPTGISIYFVDITQSKKANEEIAKSEEKRRLIMNGALDAIVTIDTNETINFWNPQAEVIFGWKAEEVMGKPIAEIVIPEPFRKYHVEGLKNYLKTGEGKALNVLLDLTAIRRNKEEFPIELTLVPIKQGGEEFFCAFIRDITQRKKA